MTSQYVESTIFVLGKHDGLLEDKTIIDKQIKLHVCTLNGTFTDAHVKNRQCIAA